MCKRDGFHANDPSSLIPPGLDAHGIQNLRLQHAQVAHGFCAPHREGQFFGKFAVRKLIGSNQLLYRLLASLKG